MLFYLWSYKHNKWWGMGCQGYTEDLGLAGIYTSIGMREVIGDSMFMETIAIPQHIAERYGPPSNFPYEDKGLNVRE